MTKDDQNETTAGVTSEHLQAQGQTQNPTPASAPNSLATAEEEAANPPAPAAAVSTPAGVSPVPHEDGGATLTPAAGAPSLLAVIELYKTSEGIYIVNITEGGNTRPQWQGDEPTDVSDYIGESLAGLLA